MKINLENVNLNSSTGPNSFGKKLHSALLNKGHEFTSYEEADVSLCFIEGLNVMQNLRTPRIQRLDGIYFNKQQNYEAQNFNIKLTYDWSDGVVFQSHFNKKLTTKYFGEHSRSVVIHNGADVGTIQEIKPAKIYANKVWSCASSWRPHKRLGENIRYFLEHKEEGDVLCVAGETPHIVKDPSIYYLGNLSQDKLYSLYKRSDYFLHLAWLDHCPNVVVDARACGAQIICSDSGGTKEIAGLDAIVLEEEEWDFQPVKLYEPPSIDFEKKVDNLFDSDYDIVSVSQKYEDFMKNFV